jgi:hypothetical protein
VGAVVSEEYGLNTLYPALLANGLALSVFLACSAWQRRRTGIAKAFVCVHALNLAALFGQFVTPPGSWTLWVPIAILILATGEVVRHRAKRVPYLACIVGFLATIVHQCALWYPFSTWHGLPTSCCLGILCTVFLMGVTISPVEQAACLAWVFLCQSPSIAPWHDLSQWSPAINQLWVSLALVSACHGLRQRQPDLHGLKRVGSDPAS